MERRDKIYKLVLQSSTKGIRAIEIASKLQIHKTVVYRDLNSLYLMGKVESDQGIWRAKTGEQTIQPLEKEIVIELPIPKNEWQRLALLEHFARDWEEHFPNDKNNAYRISLEKFNETRTIKIKGKNVDDIDLEKIGTLIHQAIQKSSAFSFKGLIKGLRKSLPISSAIDNEKGKDADKQ
ncbi:MAG: HTH domain-containing protein [Candidatus Bathyarchaeota archaeon]|nr:HTH domain-containing protein [Candidatus Bathyarchaeota archaeon]